MDLDACSSSIRSTETVPEAAFRATSPAACLCCWRRPYGRESRMPPNTYRPAHARRCREVYAFRPFRSPSASPWCTSDLWTAGVVIAERAACKRPAIVPAISLTRGTLIAAVGADRTLTEDTVAMGPTEARLAEVARFLEVRGRRRLNILASGRTQAGDPGTSRLLSWAVSN